MEQLMKAPAIGIENFKTIIDGEYCYVDKTELIADLVNFVVSDEKTDAPVRKTKPALNGISLFLRPRRFGKTLTLSMLKYFFDIDEKENSYLFDGLAIANEKGICEQFQNRFPVISLTLKDVKGRNEEEFLEAFNDCLKNEYKRHAYAKSSLTDKNDIATFERLSVGDGTKGDFKKYLSLLIQALYDYHKVKPIVLIDEYDVPLNTAHQNKCYDYVVDIISSMFSKGLKTNDNLQAGIITGCLQIAKNQIFTGLNNPGVYSVTRPVFAQYFGFTKEETAEVLHSYNLDDRADDVRDNYDGYTIGKYSIYNPFSLLNFIMDTMAVKDAECQNYWASSSGNVLLRQMLESCKEDKNKDLKETFETLLAGSMMDVQVDKTVTYDTMTGSLSAIMGTLLFSGYLTATGKPVAGKYTLRIPNREVLDCFRVLADEYNKERVDSPDPQLLKSFAEGDPLGAEQYIQAILNTVITYWDMTKANEDFPHGYLAGVLSSLNEGNKWRIKSENEGGDGRSDIMLSNAKKKEAVIIEVKRTGAEKEMDRLLAEGLKQIDDNKYDAEYKTYHYAVLKYCVCFCGKSVKVKMAEN
jgi:hypothetical protein